MLKNATTKRRLIATAALSFAMLGATTAANADHDRGFRGRRDADLEVKARLNCRRGGAQLDVRIKAEIEGRFLRDRYNVILTIAPAHPGFGGQFVQPQTVIVPLQRPSDIDADEVEFNQRAMILLPLNLARFGDSLIVNAELVSATTGRALDRDQSFVRQDVRPIPRHGRHRGHRGHGIGGRVIW